MTLNQEQAIRCGMVPEDNPPEFFAKHLSPYAFLRPSVKAKTVLEIGFGDGYGMNYLGACAEKIVGLDIAPDNIPLAKAKYPSNNLEFIRFDGTRFPLEDRRFDAAITCQVIEHIPEDRVVEWLLEIRRVLKPGGRLIVSTLNLAHAMKPGRPYEKNIDHEKEYTAEELERLLKKAFPDTKLFGLHYSRKHRFFRRLKKWGMHRWLPAKLNFVKRHFDSVTVDDFVIHDRQNTLAIDLIALCRA